HGIGTILDAADRLVHIPGIRFHIIGDGQESWRISQYLESSRAANLIWERGMFSTEHIVHAIAKADLCLGIFAESPKAQRVLPYKIYYYAALGKPFVTRSTVCLRRYFPQTDNVLLCKMEDDSGASLAGMIDHYYHNPEELNKAARESAELYQQYLSPQQLQVQLTGLFSRQQVKSV
ncbi:MAG: hypothetical protein WD601_12100, partial [Pseudohongiellaceae bacterium]